MDVATRLMLRMNACFRRGGRMFDTWVVELPELGLIRQLSLLLWLASSGTSWSPATHDACYDAAQDAQCNCGRLGAGDAYTKGLKRGEISGCQQATAHRHPERRGFAALGEVG